jgi:hypothetical protein
MNTKGIVMQQTLIERPIQRTSRRSFAAKSPAAMNQAGKLGAAHDTLGTAHE